MKKEELDFIGSMNMCDEISNEAYKKIVCHCREQDDCEDAVSRQAVHDLIAELLSDYLHDEDREKIEELDVKIEDLESVTPKEKIGHWESYCYQNNSCSVCGYIIADSDTDEYKYCPNCGARMVSE